MSGLRDRFGGTSNDAVAAQMVAARRRRVWRTMIVASVVALIAAMAGCLFMMRTQGVQSEVARMRDEVGMSLTMMSLGGASEAVARHLPGLIDTTGRWNRKFAKRSEAFRGMDAEINQVQAMYRLGETAERWRKELEGVSPMHRNELWQKSVKAQIEAEQKKWPNRVHKKGASEWMKDMWKEFWFGIQYGCMWPKGVYARTVELAKGGRALDGLEVGDCLRYILFPYRLSAFTMLRFMGIVLAMSALGYLMCWIGLKSRFGWLSYAGLLYFVYLLVIALFIVYLEVSK